MSVYPDRNPFPPQATMTIEGRLTYSLEGVPTAQTQHMARLVSLVERYLTDDAVGRTGRAVALHGEHGTGKTHSLLFALAEATARVTAEKPPLALYVRADGPEPVLLYRKLMSRVAQTDLTALVEEAFAGYAADAYSISRVTAGQDYEDVAGQLRGDPGLVLDAIRTKDLSWSATVDRQETDIERIQGQRRFGKFDRAVRALLEPELASLAYLWLIGETLDRDGLKRLGVTTNLEDPEHARVGVHVIAALAGAARRPLLLTIDQVEAFVMTPDGLVDQAAAGWLRALVEAMIAESGFLVASISERAWRMLPKDLIMRFGPSEIGVQGRLTVKDAEAVLAAYLAPWQSDSPSGSSFPFEREAVRQLLVDSGGNLRRFLQASRLAFEAAFRERQVIGAAEVKEAMAGLAQRAPNEAEVRATVERVLETSQVLYRWNEADDGRVTYTGLRGSQPCLVVQVSGAVFAQDEAQTAVDSLTTIKTAREKRVPILLVVLGYSSPDVTSMLDEAATQVLVAEADTFEVELKAAVGAALADEPPQLGTELQARLEDLQKEMAKLAARRGEDEQLVSERLRAVDAQMTENQWTQQLRVYRQAWLQERQRLEDEINRSRTERKRADVAEVVNLHRDFLRRRQSRRRLLLLGSGAWIVVGAVVASIVVADPLRVPILVGGLLSVILIAGAEFVLSNRRAAATEEPNRILTVEDLERIIRQRAGGADVVRDGYWIASLDPYRRYAAAQSGGISVERLIQAAEVEPARIVRHQLVSTALAQEPDAATRILQANLDVSTLSVVVEAASRSGHLGLRDGYDRGQTARIPERLSILPLLYDEPAIRNRFLDRFLERVMQSQRQDPSTDDPEEPAAILAKAFTTEDDALLARGVEAISERTLRSATAQLSPLSDDGLGSYYWLEQLSLIDDLYLFFRRAAFFVAGGVQAMAPSTGPA